MKVEVFERFIREYYYDELVEVVQNYPERQSLVIDFKDLDRFDTELADQLLDNPDETIPLLKQAVAEVFIPAAKEIKINYRFKNLPKSREIRIRDIRSEHLGKLIAVEGIVRVRGEVRPEITKAIFECPGCGKEITIDQVGDLKPPVECECGRTRNFKLKKRVFSDVQRLLIEEPAEILVGGEAPSDIHVKLSEDLASPSAQAKIIPGNKVRIIGITRELPVRGKSLKYDIYLEANYVEPRELEWEELRITDEDIKRMKRLAKSKDVYDKLIKSIAPSIFGYEDIKEAIALQIFGAPAKRMPDGSRVRGDIHILVVGDPATGKTKMLEYVSKLVPRSRYVSGKGVSGVGLCVAPGSFVQLSDGSVREIRELVEEQFGFSKPEKVEVGVFRVKNKEGIKIFVLSDSLKIKNEKIAYFWKIKSPKKWIKIKTRRGKSLKVTPQTKLLTINEGEIKWKKAIDLKVKDRIASPRTLFHKDSIRKFATLRLIENENAHLVDSGENLSNSDIFWDEVKEVKEIEPESEWTYDLTTENSHNFIANGLVVHNTATVRRDESFMGGWVLEAGALVLTNKSILCIDEFGQISKEDQIAMNQALSIQSYHKDLPLLLASGEVIKIGDFVEGLFEKNKERVREGVNCYYLPLHEEIEVLSTNFDKIIKNKIIGVSKHRAPDKFYKIQIHTGREVTVTPEHPCYVMRDGRIKTVKAEELKVGDYVPIPLHLPIKGEVQPLGVDPSEIRSNHYNAKHILVPLHNSPEFCEFVGYMISEGCADWRRRKKSGVCFTNSNERILNKFSTIMDGLFGLRAPYLQEEGRTMQYFVSIELKNFIEKLDPLLYSGAKSKRIPRVLFKSRKSDLKYLLRALYDGDGGLSTSKTGSGLLIDYGTSSYELAKQVSDLLLRFGIISYIREGLDDHGNLFYTVHIGGQDNLRKFITEIGFPSREKQKKVKDYLKSKDIYRKCLVDTIPGNINKKLKAVMEKMKAYRVETIGFIGTHHFNGKLNFTRKTFQRIVHNLEKRLEYIREMKTKLKQIEPTKESLGELRRIRKKLRISTIELSQRLGVSHQLVSYRELHHPTSSFAEREKSGILEIVNEMLSTQEQLEFFRRLAFGSIGWVRVTEIEEVKNKGDKWVYDVSVPNKNFISAGMVLHNSISVAKASIVATLPSQTAVLAGANPKLGRFDPYTPIADQLAIPPTLLSRFDLKFVMRDIPNPELDSKMAEHMLNAQMGKQEVAKPALEPEFIRKYVAYARQNCNPKLTKEAGDRLKEYYVSLRKRHAREEIPAIPLTPRQYEALIRLATASARVRLDDKVRIQDAERAIRLLQTSLTQLGMSPETGEIDIDIVEIGIPSAQRSKMFRILDAIKELEETIGKSIPIDDLIVKVKEKGIEEAEVEQIIQKLKERGEIFEPKPGFIRKI